MPSPEALRKAKDARLRKVYGITLEDYEGLLASQGNRCGFPTCSRVFEPGKRFSVDHDHESGEVRAIVCYTDNRYVIGSFNIERAHALYRYLTDPPARRYFGEARYVPKGMENGQPRRRKKRKTVKRNPRT